MVTVPHVTKSLCQAYGISCSVMTGLLLYLMSQKPAVVNPYFTPWLVTSAGCALYCLIVEPPVRTLENVSESLAEERANANKA